MEASADLLSSSSSEMSLCGSVPSNAMLRASESLAENLILDPFPSAGSTVREDGVNMFRPDGDYGHDTFRTRKSRNTIRKRLDWESFNQKMSPMEFSRFYRMSQKTFRDLCDRLRSALQRQDQMTERWSINGAISPELQLSMTLRFLAGGSYLDICENHGVHRSTFFTIVWRVVNAIDKVLTVNPLWDDVEALLGISAGFQKSCNPLHGCVGCLDGLAIRVRRPVNCAHGGSFYNRKGFYAFVLQAVCDSKLRFLFGSCICTGSTHDSVAFGASYLGQRLQEQGLPGGFWIAADDAYAAIDCILTPWPGRNLTPEQSSFNYWLSSLRVHIERAFGILVRRWGIMWRAIEVNYKQVPLLIAVLLKLHNLCLSQGDEVPEPHAGNKHSGDTYQLFFQDQCDDEPLLRRGRRRDLERSSRRRDKTDQLLKAGIKRPVQKTDRQIVLRRSAHHS